MPIIKHITDATHRDPTLSSFPDQFVSTNVKKSNSWIKQNMDYFATRAFHSYFKKKETIGRNYRILDGIIKKEDFYIEPEVRSFTETLMKNNDLPSHVKHYSIMNVPVNILCGEMTNRQDTYLVRATDDYSKSEQFEFVNSVVMDYFSSIFKEKIKAEGDDKENVDVDEKLIESMKSQIADYTSIGEKWGSAIIESLSADFNLKKMSEDVFKDEIISSSGYFHIYEDNSKIGFNVCKENPINVWEFGSGEYEYTSDPTGRARGVYAIGTIKVMELSEIIESCPELTKKEIDHLRTSRDQFGMLNARQPNLGNPNAKPGWESVMYDTYDPGAMEYRMISESILGHSQDSLLDIFDGRHIGYLGERFVVIRAYWISKRKIGKLTFLDPFGVIQTEIVDESYVPGSHPGEISIEWGWMNQWFSGIKIGQDVYHVKPLKILKYCPIIGVRMNSTPIIQMMIPYQILYNVCVNQIFELFQKEIGNVVSINTRRIPKLKDGSDEDALDMLILEAKERGILQDDDSPENLKAPVSNTTVARNIDLSRSNEMVTRINIATWLRNECWSLVGMNNERVGRTLATMTATGVQNNLRQSYAHTEPLFVAHQHLMMQLYQSILDAALYTERNKPMSTITYINSKGTSVFSMATPDDISVRDLKIFVVSRNRDIQNFETLNELAKPMLMNPDLASDAFKILSSSSIREMERILDSISKKRMELAMAQVQSSNAANEMQMQIEAEKIKLQREKMEKESYENQLDRLHDAYQRDLDRINKKEIEIIQAVGYGNVPYPDEDADTVPDVYQESEFSRQRKETESKYQLQLLSLRNKYDIDQKRLNLELEKLKVMRENMENDIKIARINAKNRSGKNK